MKPTPLRRPADRPYWHVDAKWICGIIFAFFLGISISLYIASTLTSEKVAIPVATQIAAGLFSPKGLDDPSGLEEFKAKARQQPGDKIEALPGTYITKVELETLSPRELRLRIFSQVVRPYYELGAKGVAAQQTSDPVKQAAIEQQAGLLALLNKDSHEHLQRVFLISLILLVLPLAGLVYFSAGFGRLVSPGLILVAATLPWAVMALLLQISQHSSKPVGEPAASSGPLPNVSGETLSLIVAALVPTLVAVFAIGAALLLAAIIGKIVTKMRAPKVA